MRERPIVLNGSMVQAVLAGAKTQVRKPVVWPVTGPWVGHKRMVFGPGNIDNPRILECCPLGTVGDILWVRERWAVVDADSRVVPRGVGLDNGHGFSVVYEAGYGGSGGPWRSAVHMPKWASRTALRVKDVRIEKLQDIRESDAYAEGYNWQGYPEDCEFSDKARPWFRNLWGRAHGPNAWDANPWVWVVVFERISP